MNVNLLRSQMALKGKKMTDLARACSKTRGTMSKKMNGKCVITQGDISAIVNELTLSREMAFDIFFAQEVS